MKQKKEVKKMTNQEKEEFGNLYEYVKYDVLGYDKEQALTSFMILRLKGLRGHKFMENKNIQAESDYSYHVILLTFKYCLSEIKKYCSKMSFSDDSHKFNYILKIVEKKLNFVYQRIKDKEDFDRWAELQRYENLSYEGASYIRKTQETSSNINNLW